MANNNFTNIIDPIKQLRLATSGGKFSVELIEGRQVIVPQAGMGLKEAKDFVEACMALGVRRYLTEELAKANRAAGIGWDGRYADGHPDNPQYRPDHDDIRF